MSAELTHEHSVGTTKLFATVWVWLLLLTAVEVFLAYERLEVHLMITILVGLSLIKAALIMSYSNAWGCFCSWFRLWYSAFA
jgi:cytochrome c oxidase subunit IV